jgi:type I restriction enzyme S subunit
MNEAAIAKPRAGCEERGGGAADHRSPAGSPAWPKKRLGDICEIIMGQSPDGDSYNTTGEGVPLINGPVEFSDDSFGKTIRSKFTTEPTKFCKEGDLILCVRGSTTGRMNIAGFDACVGRGVAALRAKEYQPWINHFISSIRDEIHGKGTGATFPNVSGATLADLELVVPPLPEQRRIVAILDEAFGGIATAKANAEKNLENARAIFESHLQAVFTKRGDGWERVRIDDACASIMDCVNKTAPKVGGPTQYKMIRTTNIRNGRVNLESVNYVTEATYRVWTRRQIPQPGDVLLTREAPMGEVGMLTSDDKVFLGQRIVSYRADPAKLNNRFLLYALQSGDLQGQIRALASGSTVQHMRVPDSKNIELPLPGLTEQESTVVTLDTLREETQRLATIYREKLAALDELKKSLLHQAFNGEL